MTNDAPASIPALLFQRVAESPDSDAYLYPSGDEWKKLTWREVGERVRTIAAGLLELGLKPEGRVAILCSTRYEWILLDLGILSAGGATTTIYPSSSAEDCEYILNDCEARFVFAESDAQVTKLASRRDRLKHVEQVIVLEGSAGHDGWVTTVADLEEKGRARRARDAAEADRVVESVKAESLATLIYTSGTTGPPKGVELTHANWVFEGAAVHELDILRREDLQYLWLPLAHSFGKVLVAVQLFAGFPTAVDGRVDKIVDNLGVVKPTFVCAVPRIFEKVHNKVVTGAQESALKYKIFRWAFRVGGEVSKLVREGKQPAGWLAFKQKLAHKLVFSKLHARFGGRLRFFISGSAPLSRDIAEFFHAAGILILEGYGLTETSAASFVNRPDNYKFGTVGPPVPGMEVKVAEDGEILLRGPGVMRAYHHREEETRAVLDGDGWFKTGDVGMLHEGGFLQITDRKKDLIKTSGGKYVAPQEIEKKLKAICPYVSNVLVHGNNRNFCSALITLDPDAIKGWAAENGHGSSSAEQLAEHDDVKRLMQSYIDDLNKGLGKHETIKKFAVLPGDFSEQAGELTASLKVKRKAVETKYRSVLDSFYEGAMASRE